MNNIIVSGASKGIGKTLANLLAQKGFNVIGLYNKTKIDNVNYDAFKCDISSENDIKELFRYVIKNYQKIDAVINVAAICLDNDIYDKTKDEFMKVLEVNLVGTFLMCKYATMYMKKGTIINVSSTDATDTFSTISMDYASSKAGIENITKNLANRFPNLKICAIAPNWVDTETTLSMESEYLKKEMIRVNQKRLLTKEEVALKIIDIMQNESIKSGEIIRMSDDNA